MSKFNLTFSGEIVAGVNPRQAKSRFGKMFQIQDPERIEKFFSGETVTLRRNLDRKTAAQYYSDMQKIGLVAQLVKTPTRDTVDAVAGSPGDAQEGAAEAKPAREADGEDEASRAAEAKNDETAEDETRCKTEEAAARKKAAGEEARRKAEAKEEAARRKAAAETAKKDARKKAEAHAARKKADEAEAKRKATEEAAKKKADDAKARRKAREETARKKADDTKAKRKAKKEEAEKKKAAETDETETPLPPRNTDPARKSTARPSRKRAASRTAPKTPRATTATPPPGKPTTSAAKPFASEASGAVEPAADQPRQGNITAHTPAEATAARTRPGKPPAGRVRTSLEVPRRNRPAPHSRRRQPGEPNLYQLRPFRHSADIKARADVARRAVRRSLGWASVAIAALALLSWWAATTGPVEVIGGASVVAVEPGAGPLLVAGNHLIPHDRAGVAGERIALETLGLVSIDGPMAFAPNGDLVARAQPAAQDGKARRDSRAQLVRCDLEVRQCRVETGLPDGVSVDAFVINPVDGSLLIADAAAGELLRMVPGGAITARAGVSVPAAPVLALHSGLLFMNSALGPAVSVYRYDENAFGQQLDEVLLLPPPALQAGQTAPVDLVRLQDAWWISLRNPETGSQGFYRYDGDWNYLGALDAERVAGTARFVPWSRRMLLHERTRSSMQRFNAQGEPEVAFVSTQLEALSRDSQRRAGLVALAWRVALIACMVLGVLSLLRAHLQRLRALVYKSGRERGAEPVEDHADELVWVDPAENRRARLRQRGASYGAIVLAAVALAISREVDALALGALLVAAAGPAIALLLIALRPTGNIARLDRRLLLVDHRGIYQFAGGSRVQHRGGFLVIDDVVVHTGNRLLPAFSPASFMAVAPRAIAGAVRVDRNTILVKLLESRHPLAQGGIAIIATTVCALCLLALRGIF